MNTNASWQQKTDQELVAMALKDRHAFSAIMEKYENPLARYIRRLGADSELAKDILQESFIKVYVHLNDYDSSLSFSAWLYRIVHNEAISQFRKQRARPAPIEHEGDLALFDTIADGFDIVADSDRQLSLAAVQGALQSLPSKYRDVLVLRYFEDKSYDEISDILQVPLGTVGTNISRAQAKLKEILKKDKTVDV